MSKYILDIVAGKEVTEYNYGTYKKIVYITESEIYEAITKYIQVKGFDASKVSVEEYEESEVKL